MSQNHHLPTPECAAFAPLLPLASHDLLNEAEDTRLRAHLATCAHCRAELTLYDHVEEALRRSFAPRQEALPPFSREEIMQTLDHHEDHPAPVAPLPVPVASERRPRRLLSGLAALAATLVIVVLAAGIFSIYAHRSKTAGPATQSIATPTPARGSQAWLTSISMVSPTEGWAVGYGTPPVGYGTPPTESNNASVLLMHYKNGAWSPVHTPLKGRINSISMDSATDGWAVGDAVALHYDGKTWQQAHNAPQELYTQVQMLSPTDGWAVGYQGGSLDMPAAIWHYDGRDWTAQHLPAGLNLESKNSISLYSLSMLSPTQGWAAGTLNPISTTSSPTQAPSGIILRYASGQWSVDDLINGATIQSVSMASAADGWAAGNTDTLTQITVDGQPTTEDTTLALLLHYTGGKWVTVPNPNYTGDQGGSFKIISLSSATDSWLTAGTDALNAPILLHYNGAQWQQVSVPSIKTVRFYTIFGIAMTSANEGWAVGASTSTEENGIPNPSGHGYQPTVIPVILHYLNGAWSIYQS